MHIVVCQLLEDFVILNISSSDNLDIDFKQEKGRPLPKFGEWDVNDPASAEGFTVIFNKARDEKKTGGKPDSPSKADGNRKEGEEPLKPQTNFPLAVSISKFLLYSGQIIYHLLELPV
ncbi:hypothetical protein KY285_025056 [Solanum tuberosum]|nr:hypothetical protein KY289_025286 [Solanum tuberosum]KAH0677255.1 hypothetical protein KY285_025056 [Solanum tuberosum]